MTFRVGVYWMTNWTDGPQTPTADCTTICMFTLCEELFHKLYKPRMRL